MFLAGVFLRTLHSFVSRVSKEVWRFFFLCISFLFPRHLGYTEEPEVWRHGTCGSFSGVLADLCVRDMACASLPAVTVFRSFYKGAFGTTVRACTFTVRGFSFVRYFLFLGWGVVVGVGVDNSGLVVFRNFVNERFFITF